MFWADQFEDRVCLLTLEGRLSRMALVNLADRLRGLAARGMFQVVVDMHRVEHWDFRGLRALGEAVRFRSERGGATAFITPNPYLKDVAKAAGVFDLLDFYDSLRLESPAEFDMAGAAMEHASSIRQVGSS